MFLTEDRVMYGDRAIALPHSGVADTRAQGPACTDLGFTQQSTVQVPEHRPAWAAFGKEQRRG